ncbi:MAG: 2-oxoglutarate dehydrogenase complex dihydrolipoyllysine-residue succinyltransferase [Nannocystaceae bacterium]
MAAAIKVPALGESITEAIISRWLKQVGDPVRGDEPIVELETDKVSVEVPAPVAGVLSRQLAQEGDTVEVGDLIAELDTDLAAAATNIGSAVAGSVGAAGRATTAGVAGDGEPPWPGAPAMPSARAEAVRTDVDLASVQGTGRNGRILKTDVQQFAAEGTSKVVSPGGGELARPAPVTAELGAQRSATTSPSLAIRPDAPPEAGPDRARDEDAEEVRRMTPLRRRVAERLVAAQQSAAILTTFNEVDMSAVMEVRTLYKDAFMQRHGVKLGFMSFFIKAAIESLRSFPSVNAEIRGENVVYKKYYHVGVAVGGGKGLVVPVLRHVDRMGFAQIEGEIIRLAALARDNKLSIADLKGGTFTISNGGVYGSMLSTPILNPPQTGILGLHNITQRPMAVRGKVEIRPIMYLALSYDHRLVDGREAVGFLVRIKEAIEDPRRLMLAV